MIATRVNLIYFIARLREYNRFGGRLANGRIIQ